MRTWTTFLLLVLCACGGMTGGSTSATREAGSWTPIPEDAGIAPPAAASCPSVKPTVGKSCDAGLECEFGTSPFLSCDGFFDCNDGLWTLADDVPSLCAAATSVCTSSTPVAGAACSQAALNTPGCDTEAGMYCYCYGTQTTAHWICTPHGPGCPASRPRLGSPCSLDAGSQCDYAGLDDDGIMECGTAGVWYLRVNP
jgi:hypothetical protein